MKVSLFLLLGSAALSLLFTACTTESDPAPKCNTKSITYQEFKDNYKPEKKETMAKNEQEFLFDGDIKGSITSNKTHYTDSAFNAQQIRQSEIVSEVQSYDRK